eukprot:PhM_4_TR11384/c0_g1_i1/m.31337
MLHDPEDLDDSKKGTLIGGIFGPLGAVFLYPLNPRPAVGHGLLQGIGLHFIWLGLLCIAFGISVSVVLQGKFCNDANYPFGTVQNVITCPHGAGVLNNGSSCFLCCPQDPERHGLGCLIDYRMPTVYDHAYYERMLLSVGGGLVVCSAGLLLWSSYLYRKSYRDELPSTLAFYE